MKRSLALLLAAVPLWFSSCAPPPIAVPRDEPAVRPEPAVRVEPVRFSDDDFEAALARAKQANQLLFVDAWAPWCHTCLSMREVVLSRAELGRFSKDFSFVAVDTDRPVNAAFVERYHMRVWPTFFVIDPNTGAVLALYGGSVSYEEMVSFLDRAKLARNQPDVGSNTLAQAHAAYGERRFSDAARLYEQAAGSVADSLRSEPLVGGLRAFWEAEDFASCVRFGRLHLDAVPGSSAPSDFALTLRECAKKLPEADDKREALEATRARLAALALTPPQGASVDDRANTFAALAEIARDAKDDATARSLEEKRLAILEDAVRKATSIAEAQVHDYERMLSLIALGRGEEAVTMLTRRTREMPENYEPFARLGAALIEVGRPREAVTALDRAIALSYGARRTRYLALRAKALGQLGDHQAEVLAIELEILALGELPEKQRDPKRLLDAEKRLVAARAKTTPSTTRTPR